MLKNAEKVFMRRAAALSQLEGALFVMRGKTNHSISVSKGFTLLELLIVIVIMGIIVSVGIPSMRRFADNARLVGAAEQVYGHLQQAKSEAVARFGTIYVPFTVSGGSWTYGISENSGCVPSVTTNTGANACVLTVDNGNGTFLAADDLVLMRFSDADYPGVTSGGATALITFDPLRGTSNSGQVNLTGSNGNNLRVTVGVLGRVSICTPDGSMDAYLDC